jgi:hypothetical protein
MVPASIPVRYSDEDAGFVSVRPVLRMTLRPEQLVELVLGVTGKNLERVEQILRSGSVAAGGFRYWWDAMDVSAGELVALMAAFPDADPARAFDAARCTVVIAEGSVGTAALAEFERLAASRRRVLHRRSFWDALLDAAREGKLGYRGYSYGRRADLYALELAQKQGETLAREAQELGTGDVRGLAAAFARAARLVYVCGR